MVRTDVAIVGACRLSSCSHVFTRSDRIGVAVQIGIANVRACSPRRRAVDVFVRAVIESDDVALDDTRRPGNIARTVARVTRPERPCRALFVSRGRARARLSMCSPYYLRKPETAQFVCLALMELNAFSSRGP